MHFLVTRQTAARGGVAGAQRNSGLLDWLSNCGRCCQGPQAPEGKSAEKQSADKERKVRSPQAKLVGAYFASRCLICMSVVEVKKLAKGLALHSATVRATGSIGFGQIACDNM